MLMNKFNDNFARHFNSKTNYTSWFVQNTIINLCAKYIRGMWGKMGPWGKVKG